MRIGVARPRVERAERREAEPLQPVTRALGVRGQKLEHVVDATGAAGRELVELPAILVLASDELGGGEHEPACDRQRRKRGQQESAHVADPIADRDEQQDRQHREDNLPARTREDRDAGAEHDRGAPIGDPPRGSPGEERQAADDHEHPAHGADRERIGAIAAGEPDPEPARHEVELRAQDDEQAGEHADGEQRVHDASQLLDPRQHHRRDHDEHDPVGKRREDEPRYLRARRRPQRRDASPDEEAPARHERRRAQVPERRFAPEDPTHDRDARKQRNSHVEDPWIRNEVGRSRLDHDLERKHREHDGERPRRPQDRDGEEQRDEGDRERRHGTVMLSVESRVKNHCGDAAADARTSTIESSRARISKA